MLTGSSFLHSLVDISACIYRGSDNLYLHICQLSFFWTEYPSFSSHGNLRPRRVKSPSLEHRRQCLCWVIMICISKRWLASKLKGQNRHCLLHLPICQLQKKCREHQMLLLSLSLTSLSHLTWSLMQAVSFELT